MHSHIITIKEIDDVNYALKELNEQMSKIKLYKNTLGIVAVHPDFIDSGVYAAICDVLPFQLVGIETFSQTVNNNTEMFLLSIMVLTSNTNEFSYENSQTSTNENEITTQAINCYQKAAKKLTGKPKLALLYTPFPEENYTGVACKCFRAISETDKNLPIFGSLSCRELEMVTESKVVFGKEVSNNQFALVLISGDISPEFYVGSITEDVSVVSLIGVVTSSHNNLVKEINGVNIKKFFNEMDFFIDKDITSTILSGIVVAEKKDENGNILSRRTQGIMSLTDDDHALFGDHIEEGTVLSFAVLSEDVVIATTDRLISQIKEHKNKTVLIYSCLSRWFASSLDKDRECNALKNELSGSFNFQMAYSGGELCPASKKGETIHNAKHSASIIACVF